MYSIALPQAIQSDAIRRLKGGWRWGTSLAAALCSRQLQASFFKPYVAVSTMVAFGAYKDLRELLSSIS
jgi:hypothetical protein